MAARKSFTAAARQRVLTRHDRKCAMCQVEITPATGCEYDHHIPLSIGGDDTEANLRPVCVRCHRLKSKADTTRAAKTKRQEDKALTKPTARRPIRSRGFSEPKPKKEHPPPLPRRALYGETT
jgi:5-methylcytosine-specific restriction endonuclease McrA